MKHPYTEPLTRYYLATTNRFGSYRTRTSSSRIVICCIKQDSDAVWSRPKLKDTEQLGENQTQIRVEGITLPTCANLA